MMNFRGVSNQTIFVGDLCFAACIGLLISAQWEMVRGNTFSYTVLSAYGEFYLAPEGVNIHPPAMSRHRLHFLTIRHKIAMFYGGYGATLIPAFGIIDAYGGFTSEYYNALGFFILCKLDPS